MGIDQHSGTFSWWKHSSLVLGSSIAVVVPGSWYLISFTINTCLQMSMHSSYAFVTDSNRMHKSEGTPRHNYDVLGRWMKVLNQKHHYKYLPKLYYRLQRSRGKVMFLQASVILLTGGSTSHPPKQTPPRADTPPAHPPEQTPPHWSRHPLEQTPPEQTPPEQTPPGLSTPP